MLLLVKLTFCMHITQLHTHTPRSHAGAFASHGGQLVQTRLRFKHSQKLCQMQAEVNTIDRTKRSANKSVVHIHCGLTPTNVVSSSLIPMFCRSFLFSVSFDNHRLFPYKYYYLSFYGGFFSPLRMVRAE